MIFHAFTSRVAAVELGNINNIAFTLEHMVISTYRVGSSPLRSCQRTRATNQYPSFLCSLGLPRDISVLAALFLLCCITTTDAQRVGGVGVDTNPEDQVYAARLNNGIQLVENQPYRLRLFGTGFTDDSDMQSEMVIKFSETPRDAGADCEHDSQTKEYMVERQNDITGTVTVALAKSANPDSTWYMCIKSGKNAPAGGSRWVHQGQESWQRIKILDVPEKYKLKSLPFQITLIILLLGFNGLFNGLNLGLMSLDLTELKIIENSGTRKERKYARRIRPLRQRGNLLLCTIVLGSTLISASFTILLDDLMTSGWYAIIMSTLGLTIFGEIVPQAVCSRFGLAIGAHTILLPQILMFITFPLAWPISKVLDCLLGEEIGAVYNRERLAELIKLSQEHDKLATDEAHIIAGALELKTKTAGEIMTLITDVFMIPANAVLNFATVSEIMRQGYTRIPVYDTAPDNIVALLNIKDLCLVDPDDNTPVLTLCKFYNHHVHFVLDDTTLDVLLDTFRQGQTHLALVQRIDAAGCDHDPEYHTVGVVTLEDVIEEIIQAEIVDESDLVSGDPRRAKRRNNDMAAKQDFSLFNSDYAASLVTPQLQLAAFQFLSAALEHFRSDLITPTILHRLINHPDVAVAFHMRAEMSAHGGGSGGADLSMVPLIYQAGKPCDFFILILEGRVEVKCGKEGITFQGGPFSYFGISSLTIGRQDEELYVRATTRINGESAGNNNSEPTTIGNNTSNNVNTGTQPSGPAADIGSPSPEQQNINANMHAANSARGALSLADSRVLVSYQARSTRPAAAAGNGPATTTSEKHPLIDGMVGSENDSQQQHRKQIAFAANAMTLDESAAVDPACNNTTQQGVTRDVPITATDSQQQQQQQKTLFSRTDVAGETNEPFIPDYDVRPVSDLLYLRITRAHYIAAFRASQYERKAEQGRSTGVGARSAVEYFRSEFDKFSHHRHHHHPNGGSGGASAGMRARHISTPTPSFRPPSQSGQPIVEQEVRPAVVAVEPLSAASNSNNNQSAQINSISRQLLHQRQTSLSGGNMQYLSLLGRSPKSSRRMARQHSSSSGSTLPGAFVGVVDSTASDNKSKPSGAVFLPLLPVSYITAAAPDDAVKGSENGIGVAGEVEGEGAPRLLSSPGWSLHEEEAAADDGNNNDDDDNDGNGDDLESDIRLNEKGRRQHEKLIKQNQLSRWGRVSSANPAHKELVPVAISLELRHADSNKDAAASVDEKNASSASREGGGIVSGAPRHSNIVASNSSTRNDKNDNGRETVKDKLGFRVVLASQDGSETEERVV